jgi:dipeptidyl aminopeptidase/acylaminoacyl peptidase
MSNFILKKLKIPFAAVSFYFLIFCFAISGTLSWNNFYKIRNVSRPYWKPDTAEIVFSVRDSGTGINSLCIVKADGGPLIKLFESEKGFSLIDDPWSKDEKRLFFTQENSIWEIDVETKNIRELVKFAGYSKGYIPQVYFGEMSPSLSPDGSELGFSWESEIYVLNIEKGGFTQITQSYPEGWHNFGPRWSPDGKYILFTSVDTRPQDSFINLTFGKIMGFKKSLIGLSDVKLGVIPSQGGSTIWMAPGLEPKYSLRGGSNVYWSPDGLQILINKISLDHTKREILVADPKTGVAKIIYTEKVPHWISPLAIWVRYSPDGKKILFTSEKTGWNHIYVMDVSGGEPKQITDGRFTVVSNQVYDLSEVSPVWSKDGSKIYFPSNEGDTAEKHFYVVSSSGGERTRLTSMSGVNSNLTLSPDEKKIAFFYSDLSHLPELYVMDNSKRAKPIQLTDIYLPDEIKGQKWVEKKVIRYKNLNDGTEIAALLYLPAEFQKNKKYPAVVFAHGAGYRQEVYKGNWGERFLFNEYLAQQGYVVLAPDFRGSAGYGEKFRMDVFNRLGFIDLDDVLFGVDYLKKLGFVDERKIGIWGHSYGGFMTCMAMFRAPDIFLAGAASAPVTDWERFFYLAPGYNEEHFGFPWENPEGTKNCSPLHYVKNLKNHFLLLSGIQDGMHLDAEALVIELLKHRKDFEMVFYPEEAHGIITPTAIEDKYRRILRIFDTYLKNK